MTHEPIIRILKAQLLNANISTPFSTITHPTLRRNILKRTVVSCPTPTFLTAKERVTARIKAEHDSIQGDAEPLGVIPEGRGFRAIYGSPFNKELNDKQQAHILRNLFQLTYGAHNDSAMIEAVPWLNMNGDKFSKYLKFAQNYVTQQIYCAFYNKRRRAHWWQWYAYLFGALSLPDDRELFLDRAALLIRDAIGFPGTIKGEYRTTTVLGLVKQMRANEEFGIMPILADALQDVGYNDGQVLFHLQNNRYWSFGSWIFRQFGAL